MTDTQKCNDLMWQYFSLKRARRQLDERIKDLEARINTELEGPKEMPMIKNV